MFRVMCERFAGIGARSALQLLHAVNGKAWEDNTAVFSQIRRIGPKSIAVLGSNGIKSRSRTSSLTVAWQNLLEQQATFIEVTLHRTAPFGRQVLDEAAGLPRFQVTVQ